MGHRVVTFEQLFHSKLYLKLLKMSQTKATLLILGTEDIYITSGNGLFTYCEAGALVWVQVVESGQISGGTNMFSIFTGFLVNQIF